MHPSNRLPNIKRRVQRAFDKAFPECTDPASRHVRLMADALASGRGYPMLTEEPQHCALSLYATVEALWKARMEIRRLTQHDERGA